MDQHISLNIMRWNPSNWHFCDTQPRVCLLICFIDYMYLFKFTTYRFFSNLLICISLLFLTYCFNSLFLFDFTRFVCFLNDYVCVLKNINKVNWIAYDSSETKILSFWRRWSDWTLVIEDTATQREDLKHTLSIHV